MKTKILNKGNKSIGNKLAELRINKKLSQEEMAAKFQLAGLDISRATLSKIELGKRQLYLTEAIYIAQTFEITISELIEYIYS